MSSNSENKIFKTYFIPVPRQLYPKCKELTCIQGRIYSKTVSFVKKMHRRKNFWPSINTTKKYIIRWQEDINIHTHSKQQLVEEYYEQLKSFFSNKKKNPDQRPPFKTPKYRTFTWKNTQVKLLEDSTLRLSLGKEYLYIKTKLPTESIEIREVKLVFNKNTKKFFLHVSMFMDVSNLPKIDKIISGRTCGVDLGVKKLITVYDGKKVLTYHGGEVQSKLRYRNKELGKIQSKQSKCKKYSRKWRKLQKGKKKMLNKISNQIKDILHKVTSNFISWCLSRGIDTIVIGDIRKIRDNVNYNDNQNQKIHQWIYGILIDMLKQKQSYFGIVVKFINEQYTTKTCPKCGIKNHTSNRNYKCSNCGFTYHRDGVGQINIWKRYRGIDHVVGVLASPSGVRYHPHLSCHGVSFSPWKPV